MSGTDFVLVYLSFHVDVQIAYFGPSLNNTFLQKDVPGRTSLHVETTEGLKALCVGVTADSVIRLFFVF